MRSRHVLANLAKLRDKNENNYAYMIKQILNDLYEIRANNYAYEKTEHAQWLGCNIEEEIDFMEAELGELIMLGLFK